VVLCSAVSLERCATRAVAGGQGDQVQAVKFVGDLQTPQEGTTGEGPYYITAGERVDRYGNPCGTTAPRRTAGS
jgi:hypothetical protein